MLGQNVFLNVFFDYNVDVYLEFLLEGHTVNQE